jgi:hypothetical protein
MFPYPQGGPPPPPRWQPPPNRWPPPGDVWIQGGGVAAPLPPENDLLRRLQMILSGQVQNQGQFGPNNPMLTKSGTYGAGPPVGPNPGLSALAAPNFGGQSRYLGPPPRFDGGFPPPQPKFSTGVRY